MTRWLQAVKGARTDAGSGRGGLSVVAGSREMAAPPQGDVRHAGVSPVLSVLSDGGGGVLPPPRADGLDPDTGALLDLLRERGPRTYGVAARELGIGATRAWVAEARLRALGCVRHDEQGRAFLREFTTVGEAACPRRPSN